MSLLDKAKAAAEKATDMAKQGVEVGKDKVGDLKAQREIDGLHKEIGVLTVSKRTGDAPADADVQIEAKVTEVIELTAEMEAEAGDV